MRKHNIRFTIVGWVGLILAVAAGGAINVGLALPAGAAWIFLCLFDHKRGMK